MGKVRFSTIGGRFIVMSAFFVIILSALTILIVIQNRNSLSSLDGIQHVRVPIRLISGNIVGSMDRVMSQQRAYMLSGNTSFKSERESVYRNEIYPALAQLKSLAQNLDRGQQQAISDVEDKIKKFESVQNSILSYFEENMLPYMQKINAADQVDWGALSTAFILKQQGESAIGARIQYSDDIRAELLQKIIEIRNYQEVLLGTEMEGIVKRLKRAQWILITLSIVIFIVLVLFTIMNIKSLRKSIQKPVSLINTLASGALPDAIESSKDELNEILEAGKILTVNIQNASRFATAIGEGRFQEQFDIASEKDILGRSLLHMRDRLRSVALEEQKRNWATAGIAELGNILRSNATRSDELYLNVLSYLIKYVNVNQGALYIVEMEDQEIILKMVACYAYGKKKHIGQEISPGQGLVGQAYYEKEPIYLKEVPDGYIHITSGLGDAPPKSIFITPLLLNEEVYGVLEMASFHDFKHHEQHFIKNACEQIASVIASVKNTERTEALLRDLQQHTEELRAQEEEMRQNMEELTATQEELARKEKEYLNKISLHRTGTCR